VQQNHLARSSMCSTMSWILRASVGAIRGFDEERRNVSISEFENRGGSRILRITIRVFAPGESRFRKADSGVLHAAT